MNRNNINRKIRSIKQSLHLKLLKQLDKIMRNILKISKDTSTAIMDLRI